MANCSYKTTLDSGEEWECPCEALLGEEHCYWHKEEGGKRPTQEMLEELKEKEIFGVYLREAKLQNANIKDSNLTKGNLQNANLGHATIHDSILTRANLQNANLGHATIHDSILLRGNFQNANLGHATIHDSILLRGNFQNANLREANLQNVDLRRSNLNAANFYNVMFDLKTRLEDCDLTEANLYRAYIDQTKSLKYTIFPKSHKEINEIISNNCGKNTNYSKKNSRFAWLLKPSVLDISMINSDIIAKILHENLAKYVGEGDRVMFFDRSSGCAIRHPENRWSHKVDLVKIDGLTDLVVENGKIKPEFIYSKNRTDLYEFSYEVYNTLYNFYKSNGRLDQAAAVHYRRGEVYRKWLREKGGFYRLKSWIFDFFVLRLLTGYGDRIERPIGASATIIFLWAIFFKLTDGIVKTVNGETVPTGWLDYIYHSITTFTSLGYSNIQPNLAVGSLPQILVAVESVLGILLMALIIFVVTYQVSR